MLRLRQYKETDAKTIAQWVQDKDTFMKWGGELFGEFPINGDVIADVYKNKNGLCKEEDNFYPWVAFDESGLVGHFIMRYINGDNKMLRFGWVVVDGNVRGKGYGTEMLRLGTKYAFEILGVDKITIGVFENNIRAHACYKKVGFHETEIVKKAPWNVVEMEMLREKHMDETNFRELIGANMDIDLVSDSVDWNQSACPWNEAENSKEHKCAVKDTSICKYFCGIKYLDSVLCSYPNENKGVLNQ